MGVGMIAAGYRILSITVDEALLDWYAYVPILLDASVVDYNHGSREALAGCRHHCASGSSEHHAARPLTLPET